MRRLMLMMTLILVAGTACTGARPAASPGELVTTDEAGTRWVEVENRTGQQMVVWYYDASRAGGRFRLGPLHPHERQVYEIPAAATVRVTDRSQKPVTGYVVRTASPR